MRRPIRSLSLAGCALSLFLVTPARAGEGDPLLGRGTEPPQAQVIGWSKDEQRFAFRVFANNAPFEMGMGDEDKPTDPLRGEDGFCKGYVNHQGKPFLGSLELRVVEAGKKVVVLPIQDQAKCTAPKKAAQRLADAKEKLASLGIDLKSTGRAWSPEEGAMRLEVKEGTGAPYTLEVLDETEDIVNEEDGVSRYKGKLQLLLRRGARKQVLWSKAFNHKHGVNEGYDAFVSAVHLSPSGRRWVVLLHTVEGGMRDRSETVSVAAIQDLPGDVTAKAE
ncbi:hypothetical protein P2318_09805 [Myxococcaceae bacterium GXIMD 01537]